MVLLTGRGEAEGGGALALRLEDRDVDEVADAAVAIGEAGDHELQARQLVRKRRDQRLVEVFVERQLGKDDGVDGVDLAPRLSGQRYDEVDHLLVGEVREPLLLEAEKSRHAGHTPPRRCAA